MCVCKTSHFSFVYSYPWTIINKNESLRTLKSKHTDSNNLYKEVTIDLQISQTVHYIWQKYMKICDNADGKRSGHLRKTSKRQRRLLSKILKANPFMTAGKAWNESKFMLNISLTTVKRYLKKNNLYSETDTEYVANSKTI